MTNEFAKQSLVTKGLDRAGSIKGFGKQGLMTKGFGKQGVIRKGFGEEGLIAKMFGKRDWSQKVGSGYKTDFANRTKSHRKVQVTA